MSLLKLPEHDLLWALDGFLWNEDEGRRLAHLASRVRRELAIVEVGSYKGKSTCFLAAGSRHGSGSPVYAVDLWDQAPFNPPDIWDRFSDQVRRAGLERIITPIRGESTQVAREWQHAIGLLFIDGNHDLHAVRADYEAWSPLVASGGTIAFHDYHPQFPGVMRLVDETVRNSPLWAGFEHHGESLVSALRPTGR